MDTPAAFGPELLQLARLVIADATDRRLKIAPAESCTGGMLCGLLTEIAGSSAVVERGFVTYSNLAKQDMLGVPGELIADHGAVSEPVARLMAEGALRESRANLAIAITGVAGPGGGTPLKPVGTVHLALARENKPIRHCRLDLGPLSRHQIRMASVHQALTMLHESITGNSQTGWA